jgi:hypothetical protein
MYLPKTFDCEAAEPKSPFMRTSMNFGGPLPGYTSVYDQTGDAPDDAQRVAWNDFSLQWYAAEQALEAKIEKKSTAAGKPVRILMTSSVTILSEFLGLLSHDGLLALFALVFVFFYMWFTIESFFLTCCGMMEIVMSLPIAFALWVLFLGNLISQLQIMAIYVIIGIGADDVFIFYDAWLQSAHAGPGVSSSIERRFAYAYRRSAAAMFVTTCTTCGSFLAGSLSKIPYVSQFCTFTAVVVLVDYLLCISFFATSVVLWEKFMARRLCCGGFGVEKSEEKSCCGPAKPWGKCFGPGCCWAAVRFCCVSLKLPCYAQPGSEGMQKPMLERFCSGPLFRFLNKAKWVLIPFWGIWLVVAVVHTAMNIRTATKPPELGVQDVDIVRILTVLREHFIFFEQPRFVTFAWGLDGDHEKGPVEIGQTREDDVARLRVGGAAELAEPEGQIALLELCRSADLGQDGNIRCPGEECLIYGTHKPGRCEAIDPTLETVKTCGRRLGGHVGGEMK